MTKPRYKTTNWKHYNQALINRGSLISWIDEEAVQQWKQIKQGNRGRPCLMVRNFNPNHELLVQFHYRHDSSGLVFYSFD